MSSAYYDANYLFKLLCLEPGSNEVRAHAATTRFICTAAHGRAEFASAAFRKVREGAATPDDCRLALAQMRADASTGNLQFLPLTDAVFDRLETVYSGPPVNATPRARTAVTPIRSSAISQPSETTPVVVHRIILLRLHQLFFHPSFSPLTAHRSFSAQTQRSSFQSPATADR